VETDNEELTKKAAIRLVLGCLKNARNNKWLAEYEADIVEIMGTWLPKFASDEDFKLVREAYEQHLKDQNDIKAEVARQKRCQKEATSLESEETKDA
jgi:hypothetical protein